MAFLSFWGPPACQRLHLSGLARGTLRGPMDYLTSTGASSAQIRGTQTEAGAPCRVVQPLVASSPSTIAAASGSNSRRCCRCYGSSITCSLLLPLGSRQFTSRSHKRQEAFWEAEHLAHDMQKEAQKVEDAEKEHSTLMGREAKSLWDCEELRVEFNRSIGRRRGPSHTRCTPTAADSRTSEGSVDGPASRVEADWQEWLRCYEGRESTFNPPLPSNNQRRDRRQRGSEEKHRQAYREQQQGRTVCVSAWESSAYGSMHEPKLHVDASEGGRNNDVSLDFLEEKPDPSEALFDYASLRGADYRDLTHEEAMRMRDAYQQKLLLDRRVRWLKARALPDPERDAAAVIRAQEPQTEETLVKSLGLDDGVRVARRLVRMEADAERQELASRIRAKMREEKLANAKLMKAALPNVQGQVVDPIKFHVARRTIRQARLLQSQLEEFLTWNSAEVLHGLLGGAAVSIHHVEQQTTKSVCHVFFTVASGHDPKDVEDRLNRAAPHLRMQMARRLELGFTPPFRFVHHAEIQPLSKHSLFRLSSEPPLRTGSSKKQKQEAIATSWRTAMNRTG